ncbi:conserved hypothetical protein [Ricinus communis]|uniref:Uncharacterized protein n=1 Tax=Ricinus communis TaxID=3988 RepID=B9RCV8_RICCO|nr:conserved hypothetical protein [Ricinus communis]
MDVVLKGINYCWYMSTWKNDSLEQSKKKSQLWKLMSHLPFIVTRIRQMVLGCWDKQHEDQTKILSKFDLGYRRTGSSYGAEESLKSSGQREYGNIC